MALGFGIFRATFIFFSIFRFTKDYIVFTNNDCMGAGYLELDPGVLVPNWRVVENGVCKIRLFFTVDLEHLAWICRRSLGVKNRCALHLLSWLWLLDEWSLLCDGFFYLTGQKV